MARPESIDNRNPGADPGLLRTQLESLSIPDEVLQKWQAIVDLMAEVVGVPAGLIMRVTGHDIEVLVSSHTPGNPYHVGDTERFFGSGLYCEAVIARRSALTVSDALADSVWRNNPDIRLGMTSYIGFPILWPNDEPFGTICVLDSRDIANSDIYRRLIGQFRDLVQQHLNLIHTDAKRQWEAAVRQRRDQDALRSSEERFATVFRMAPVPMTIAVPLTFLLLNVNDAFLAATGYGADEVIGRDAAQLDLFDGFAWRSQMQQVHTASAHVRSLELRLRAKDGVPIDCLVSVAPVTLDGQDCILTVFQDITERKNTETELIVAIEAAMRDASWFSSRVMDKLAQIRRPLGTMATLSDLTPRELEVLGLLSEGKTDDAIAETLRLSRNTVRNHLATIYSKLDVHRRSEAIVWARERGVLGYSRWKRREKSCRPG